MFFDELVISDSTAHEDGGGVYLSKGQKGHIFNRCSVTNTACVTNGGGVHFNGIAENITFADSFFVDNTAGGAGGAVYLSEQTTNLSFVDTTFRGSRAYSKAGAVYVGDYCTDVLLEGCTLENNMLSERDDDVANANAAGAYSYGAGLYVNTASRVIIKNSMFDKNTNATYGGGILLNSDNELELANVNFTENMASLCGGALATLSGNTIRIGTSSFERNQALFAGGGVCFQGEATTVSYEGGARFVDNVASQFGGGMYYKNAFSMDVKSNVNGNGDSNRVHVHGNAASMGSAIALVEITNQQPVPFSSDWLGAVVLSANTAHLGGTLFWLYDDGVMATEPAGITYYNISFDDSNVAPYGHTTATQGAKLYVDPTYDVNQYDQALSPPLVVLLHDYYNQVVVSDNTTTISLQRSTLSANIDCNDNEATLSGALSYTVRQGWARVDSMEASCAPGGSLGVDIHSEMGSANSLEDTSSAASAAALAISVFYPANATRLDFRNCYDGETSETQDDCILCPLGTYSISYSPTASCTECNGATGVTTCQGNEITLDSGYWRRMPGNEAVLECPLGEASCVGGTGTGGEICADGYEGPLCGVCAHDYYFQEGECHSCSGSYTATDIALYSVAAVFLIAVLYYVFKRFVVDVEKESRDEEMADRRLSKADPQAIAGAAASDSSTGTDADAPSTKMHPNANRRSSLAAAIAVKRAAEAKRLSVEKITKSTDATDAAYETKGAYEEAMENLSEILVALHASGFTTRLKIVISTMQIVVSAGTNLAVRMPLSFERFSGFFSFFNISIVSMIPLGCHGRMSYPDQMFLATTLPAVFCLFLYAFYRYELGRGILTTEGVDDAVAGDIESAREQREIKLREERQALLRDQLTQRYVYIFLFFSYSVLPSVTTSIFTMFPCTDVDPKGEDDDPAGDLFMRADLNVSCDSSEYALGVTWAVLMILVYPIGLPLLYYYILSKERDAIMTRKDKDKDEDTVGSSGHKDDKKRSESQLFSDGGDVEMTSMAGENPLLGGLSKNILPESPSTDLPADVKGVGGATGAKPSSAGNIETLAFLYEAYAPHYWYWEIIETYRRLFMTAVLSVVDPGTSAQAVFAVLLALFSIKLYAAHSPYGADRDGMLAEVGQFQIFFTFFGGLVMQGDLLGSDYTNTVGIVLVIINMAVFIEGSYFQWMDTLDILADMRGVTKDLKDAVMGAKDTALTAAALAAAGTTAVTAAHFFDSIDENENKSIAENDDAAQVVVCENPRRGPERKPSTQ
jgi:hypothetical protein